jgi:hypothetical protein
MSMLHKINPVGLCASKACFAPSNIILQPDHRSHQVFTLLQHGDFPGKNLTLFRCLNVSIGSRQAYGLLV